MDKVDRSKGLYLIFFIFLLFVNSFIYFFIIYDSFLRIEPWDHHYSNDIIALILFLIAIIPLTAFLSEKLVKYTVSKGLEKSKNFKRFIAGIVIVPITLFSIVMINDYSEKSLDEVINLHSTNLDYLVINNELRMDKKVHVEGLKDLLSQYRVKKMRDDWWDYNLSKEKGFEITIHSKGKPISAIIFENRIAIYNDGDVYEVLNGPVDMDWVEKIYKIYQE